MAQTKSDHSAGQGGQTHPPRGSIDPKLIDKVDVTLEAFLGDARMTVGQVAGLSAGSLVELDAPLSQTVELRLNGLAVARGELVAAGDRFAVRLLEVGT